MCRRPPATPAARVTQALSRRVRHSFQADSCQLRSRRRSAWRGQVAVPVVALAAAMSVPLPVPAAIEDLVCHPRAMGWGAWWGARYRPWLCTPSLSARRASCAPCVVAIPSLAGTKVRSQRLRRRCHGPPGRQRRRRNADGVAARDTRARRAMEHRYHPRFCPQHEGEGKASMLGEEEGAIPFAPGHELFLLQPVGKESSAHHLPPRPFPTCFT